MNDFLISICIPVFNGEDYIEESIDSILNQTENNFELIIADNCSTDSTVDIVNNYDDPRLKLHRNDSNYGIFGNFNKCIEYSKGDYIVILPHDDLIEPTMLECFSKVLNENKKCGLVYSSNYQVNAQSEKINFILSQPKNKLMDNREAFELFIQTCPIQTCMVRRDVYKNIGLFVLDLPFTGDINMWCRVALAGYEVMYIKDPQNSIRVHEDQTTKRIYDDGEYGSQILKCYQKVFELVPKTSKLYSLRSTAAIWPMKIEIIYMIKSLLVFNFISLRKHRKIFQNIFRWIGTSAAIPIFFSVFLNLIIEKISLIFLKNRSPSLKYSAK
jgi:glycosyltransferase involved in cell wall biosynthesis